MKKLCIISCPLDTFSGYGSRSRDIVEGLIKAKGEEWDIKILPQRWGDCPWGFYDDNHEIKKHYVNKQTAQPDIWIQITVPGEFQPMGKFNVGITAGIESTIPPASFIEGVNRMDLNLISSNFSKDTLLNAVFEKRENKTDKILGTIKCEKPVELLFEGLDLERYHKAPCKTGILMDIPEDFCFLYTGHWLPGKIGEDRKNTGLLIKTFLETFKGSGNKKPALILKTNVVNYSNLDRDEILKKIAHIRKDFKGMNIPNIYLLHGELTDTEMNQLNNDNKVKAFISFTKGEGYGRPLLEEAITGKPVIVSNWSGHTDFIRPEYNVLIGGELGNIKGGAENDFLLKDAQWFNINTEIASRAMKDVFKHYKKYFEKSRKQTQWLKDNYTKELMVKNLLDYFEKYNRTPETVSLKLHKLKKVGEGKKELPKLNLPKLKKVGEDKKELPKLNLPKLNKIKL